MVNKESVEHIINHYNLTRVESNFCGDKKILGYKEGKNISKLLKIESRKEWEDFMMEYKIKELPRRPDLYYDKWKSWGDWLGCDSRSDRKFLEFNEARKLVKDIGIKTKKEYMKSYKSFGNLPSNPRSYYKEEWTDWKHFLSKIDIPKSDIVFLSYEEAKNIVSSWNLKSQNEWFSLSRDNLIPINIPKTPNNFYSEWESWNDWLGHDKTPHRNFLPYHEAKSFLSDLNMTSLNEYYDYIINNEIDFLPLNPYAVYKGISIYDLLGADITKLNNVSYGEKKIMKYLNNNNVKYDHQYRFEDCRNILTLPFDFYLHEKNICIEFDGEQHFKPIKFFGGKEALRKRRNNDIIKNDYCAKNNIALLRISYQEIHLIDKILSEFT